MGYKFNPFTGNLDISPTVTVPGSNTQVIFNDSGNLGASANFKFISSRTSLEVMGAPSYGNYNLAIGINTLCGAGVPSFAVYSATITSIPDSVTLVLTGDHTVTYGVGTYARIDMSGVSTYAFVKNAVYFAGSTTITVTNAISAFYYGPGACTLYLWDAYTYTASTNENTAMMGATVAGTKSFGYGRVTTYGDGCFGVDTGTSYGSSLGGINVIWTSVGNATSFIASNFGLQYNGVDLTANFIPGTRVKIASPGGTYYKRVASFTYTAGNSQIVFDSVLTGTYYGAGNFNTSYPSTYVIGGNSVSLGRENTTLGTDSFSIGKNIVNNSNSSMVFAVGGWQGFTGSGTSEDRSIIFNTGGAGTAPNLFINYNNRIGVKTSTPVAALDVRDSTGINFATSFDASNYMKIAANYNGGAVFDSIGTGPFFEWKIATVSKLILANSGRLGVGGVAFPTAIAHLAASTTSAASFCMNAGTAPSSPIVGDVWNDSTQKTIQVFQSGIKQNLQGAIFSQTATGTAANTTSETTISSTGVGTLTLPTNFFVAGKTIRIRGYGFHSSTASPTLTLKIKFGSTVINTTGAHTHHNATNGYFEFESVITCRTTGASGTVFAQGSFLDATDTISFGNTATVTINTTNSQAITATAQWSAASASNTISLTNLTVEVIN